MDVTLCKLQGQGYENDPELQEIQFTPTHQLLSDCLIILEAVWYQVYNIGLSSNKGNHDCSFQMEVQQLMKNSMTQVLVEELYWIIQEEFKVKILKLQFHSVKLHF